MDEVDTEKALEGDLTIEDARGLLQNQLAQPQADNEAAMNEAASAAVETLVHEHADAISDEAEDQTGSAIPTLAGDPAIDGYSFAQGMVGLGVDIVEIARMEGILERTPAFAKRVFSEAEQAYCNKVANPATHYALRFAAKEAVVKALGTGIAEGIGVLDIEVERASNGKPSIKLYNRALEIAREQGIRDLAISLSYTHTDAVACALAVTNASVKASEKRKDPMEELARQFKETRGILDEL